MITNRFDVVALDDNCTRFACQRETDYGIFETIGDFTNKDDADVECDRLNEDVEAENEALEEALNAAYAPHKGGAA